MALVTVAGETFSLEWKTKVAKAAKTSGVMEERSLLLTKDWNFFHPDSYWRQVDDLWAFIRSATVEWGSLMRVRARERKARRSSVRTSEVVRMSLVGWRPLATAETEGGEPVGWGTKVESPTRGLRGGLGL